MISADAFHAARILVVDDQEANVKLLEYVLRGAGYRAVTPLSDSRQVLSMAPSLRRRLSSG